ncbi:MAG: hypothetical protein DRN88_03420 [Candidatus Hydrothermarchaeota archaeon]|nr:MAG: hypothetical protein DRN88_03420 [Candidatus Hydrothermarchaeota archaeon]
MKLLTKDRLLLILVLLSSPLAHAQIFKAEEITTFVSPDCSYESLKEFLESASCCIFINVLRCSQNLHVNKPVQLLFPSNSH